MGGWNTIQRIKYIEEEIDKLGFKFAKSKHGDWIEDHGDLSLVPKDHEALPTYSRDAELFIGSLERLEDWLHGVRWAREYDSMLKLSDAKKRTAGEEKYRTYLERGRIKAEQKKIIEILKTELIT
jgi:hypothetical protein